MKPGINITFNGASLEEYIDKEYNLEISSIQINILGDLKKATRKHIVSKGGRRRGNPGVKKAKVYSISEIEKVAEASGLLVHKR